MSGSSFGTAINCIDGRVQEPVINWMKKNRNVDFIDLITLEGPDRILFEGFPDRINILKKKVLVSINAHSSKTIVVAGHHDCAGNPVSKEEHLNHIKESVKVIQSWNFPVKIIGLWINDEWEIEIVS